MEIENKETKINVDENNNLLLKTKDNQNSNNESEEDDAKNKEPNFLKQFLIPRVYFIAISVFSISYFILPFASGLNGFIYKNISLRNKNFGRRIEPIFNSEYTEMDKEKSEELIYKYALIPLIYFCVIGPFVEEFLYRWVIFGLIKKYGQKVKKDNKLKGNLIIAFAFIFSSILFSFGHFDILGENLYIEIIYFRTYFDIELFTKSIIYAWVYSRYGYISITILVQILYNVVQTIFILYMFASDCYDHCAVRAIALAFPFFIFNIIVVIILIGRFIYKKSKCRK